MSRTVVGHKKVLSSLPNPLPHTLLLVGPEGVGKRQVAHVLAHKATGARGLDLQILEKLDKEGARAMVEHHRTYPLSSPVKTSVADLTNASTESVHSILKLLEEPAPYSRVILHSDTEPLLTIRSRCFLARFGVLSSNEVATVLSSLRVNEAVLSDAVAVSQGRVSIALEHARNAQSRRHVEAILAAFQETDAATLEHALSEALEPGNSPKETYARREVVAGLLAKSIRASLTTDHVFSVVPEPYRVEALRILESKARPALRIQSAVWTLASGV